MSEILERRAASHPTFVDRSPDGDDEGGGHRDGDTIDLEAPDAAGLVRRVSAAGFQVLQAAEGLEQAGALLRVVEELARDAEARVREAEERLDEADAERRELTELLELAYAEHEAERARTAAAERRADSTERRAESAERRAEATDERLRAALERIGSLERRLAERSANPQGSRGRPQLTVTVDGQRDELGSALAAEIRRPLTSILGLALALKHADTRSSDGTAMVRRLDASARRLERLVVQMLALDAIADGTFVPSRRRADVEALVRRVVEESPELADLEVRLRTERIALELDPTLTEQMVEAMLANAANRSAAGSPVWVEVAHVPGGVMIAVDDTCPDVPLGVRAGQPGERTPPRRTRTTNGLVLLTRLAELHGGKVWAEERPGGGTSVRLLLPAADVVRVTRTDATAGNEGKDAGRADRTFGDAPDGGRDLSSFDDLSEELAI